MLCVLWVHLGSGLGSVLGRELEKPGAVSSGGQETEAWGSGTWESVRCRVFVPHNEILMTDPFS